MNLPQNETNTAKKTVAALSNKYEIWKRRKTIL